MNRWVSPDPLTVHGLGADLNVYAYVSGQTLKATDPVGLAPEFEFTKRNDLERRAYSGGVTGLFNSLVESVKEVVSFAAAPVDPVEMKNPELRKQYGSAARSLERVAHKVKLPRPTDAAGRGGYRAGQGAGTVLDVAAVGVGGVGAVKNLVRGAAKRFAKRPLSTEEHLAALDRRAEEIHAALDPIASKQRTTAVLSGTDASGREVRVLAGGKRDLTPAQRGMAGPNEITAKDRTKHGETTAMRHADATGIEKKALVATRRFCKDCVAEIKESGAEIVGDRAAVWPAGKEPTK